MCNATSAGQMGSNNAPLNNCNNNHQGFNDMLNMQVPQFMGLQQNMSNTNGILDLYNIFNN